VKVDEDPIAGSNNVATPVLELRGLRKRYGGVLAVDDINLRIDSGETVALLGDNGAGKSTVVKMISGATRPSSGTIHIGGVQVEEHTPGRAISLGVQTVYQTLSLVDVFSVPENFFLGREMTYGGILKPLGLLRKGAMAQEARQGLARLGVAIPGYDDSKVGMMSGGQRQATAIAKAVHFGGSSLLMLDEPTAALGVRESSEVLNLVASMTEQGFTTLIVSHNIEHVWRICSRFVVLRRGHKVADLDKESTSPEEIVRYIVGAHDLDDNDASVVYEPSAPAGPTPAEGDDA